MIDHVQIYNMEEFPPLAYLGGIFAFKVLTGMPEDEFSRMVMMLQEHPLWEDLYPMEPVVAWNGMGLFLYDVEDEDGTTPIAFIALEPAAEPEAAEPEAAPEAE